MYVKQTFRRYNVLYVSMFENILLEAAFVLYIFCFKNLLVNIIKYHRFICFVLLYGDRQRSHLPVVKAFCKALDLLQVRLELETRVRACKVTLSALGCEMLLLKTPNWC